MKLPDAIAAATALLETTDAKTVTILRSLLKTLTTHAAESRKVDYTTRNMLIRIERQKDEILTLQAKVRLLEEKQKGAGQGEKKET